MTSSRYPSPSSLCINLVVYIIFIICISTSSSRRITFTPRTSACIGRSTSRGRPTFPNSDFEEKAEDAFLPPSFILETESFETTMSDSFDGDNDLQDLWNRIHEDPHRSMSRTAVLNHQWLQLAKRGYSAEKWHARCNKNGCGYFLLKSSCIDTDPIKVWTLQNAKRAGLRLDKKVIVLAKLCSANETPFNFYLDVNDPFKKIEKTPQGYVSFVIDTAKCDYTQRIQNFFNYITESKQVFSFGRTKVFVQVLYRADPNGTPVNSVPALSDAVRATFHAQAFDWRKHSLRFSFANLTDLVELRGLWLLRAHAVDLQNCDQGTADSTEYQFKGQQSFLKDLFIEERDRHAARLGYLLDACANSLKYLRLGLHGVSPQDLNSVVQKVRQCKRTTVVELFSRQPATVPVEEWLRALEDLVASTNDTALEQLEYCIPIKSEHGNDVPALEAWFEREYGPRVDAIMSRNFTLMTCLVMIHPQSTSSFRRRLFEGYVDRNIRRCLVLSAAKDVAKKENGAPLRKILEHEQVNRNANLVYEIVHICSSVWYCFLEDAAPQRKAKRWRRR